MESKDHIVEYENYCDHCKYKDIPDGAIPCDECLTDTVNKDSRKPTKYEPTDEWKHKEEIRKEKLRLASRSRLKNLNKEN